MSFLRDVKAIGLASYLYHRFVYRPLMRTAHRFDFHYAPEHGPFQDGRYQRWCQWCGMRYAYFRQDDLIHMAKGIAAQPSPQTPQKER